MPERARHDIDGEVFVRAAFVVANGQAQLQADCALDAPLVSLAATVEEVASRLASLLPADSVDVEGRARLLDWRDHLSSHVHAARALTDVQVSQAMAVHLLERGLADVAARIAERRRSDAADELLRNALRLS
jgi:hypothetical protein